MASKPKIIAGVWTTVAGIASYKSYRKAKAFEDSTPCFDSALRELSASTAARGALGNGELTVGFLSRKLHLDEVAGRARSSFMVYGDGGSAWVFMSARRGAQAQKAFEEALEEEEEQLTGFRYYWSRPWELKRFIVDSVKSATSWRKAPSDQSSDGKEPQWDLDSLFFLPESDVNLPSVLLGDARGIPEFEALCVRGDAGAKNERSRRRLHIMLGTVSGIALLAGGLRVVRSYGVSRSYGYVRRSVLEHPAVVHALGPKASIATSSGTFKPSYVNARLRLVGDGGDVADVEFAATRGHGRAIDGLWQVAVARMSWAGRSRNLDKAHF